MLRALTVLSLCSLGLSQEPETVRVMTFNLWHGGDAGKQPIERTADVIRAAKADVVGLQETHGHAVQGSRPDHGRKLAELLGWNYQAQGSMTGILTRYRILEATPKKCGVRLELAPGRRIAVFNAHLAHAPYQPYQLMKIPYMNAPFIATEKEAVDAAIKARSASVGRFVEEIRAALDEKLPVFLTGDFNEPSHLDWTERAAASGAVPIKVEYPSTRAIAETGLKDAFRTLYPDEVARRGNTWTPITEEKDPKDRHDRIDFVFFGGGASLKSCVILGEAKERADVVVYPYPSDHRAVAATFELSP